MRSVLIAAAMLLASTQSGLADNCHDKFVSLLINGNGDKPTKINIITEPKGGKLTKNEFYILNQGHWMTVMIEPVQPITLAYNNAMFTSPDEGKTWKKVRTMDSAQNKIDNIKNQKENSKTVHNAVCSEEELNGIVHETIQADFNTVQAYKSENHYKYWVNPKTGWISKVIYDSKSNGYESKTTQILIPAPDLTLPTPE